ncbi:peptidylprolyl isomerase [Rhodanobacter sp. AS-Z3]|uniref:peptidylprolyl isomerase n=1 Tax=Rhodanobacter sp. AS-Z3 TaxID=3031330 RepID=UPI00247A0E21|nr:peptidylprolyl isomerase [Rhodanobacter sp. AS-Z3]WEN16164.1 peptidylprolyl isomerase [Rhodanobacter sp. AS-Z3]
MKQTLASLLLAFAIMLPAHAQLLTSAAPASQPLDRIVAVVNDNVILQSQLNEAVASVQQQYAGHTEQLPPMNVLQQQVLNRLVLMRLQVQKAQDQGIRVSSADIDQAVQGVAQQNNLTPEQLRAEVERSGSSFAAFREQLGDQITVQRLHQSVVQDSVSVTDSEIDNLLSSPTYKAGEVHLAHIQISIPAGGDAAAIQTAQAKAEAALAAIKGGMDFNAAAIRYSDASDALDGGDLGWRRMDEIPPAFADTIATMKAGEVSPALRGPTGFHILKLMGQRENNRTMVTELHARQILIRPSELVTPEQAEQKARDLYHRIVDKHEDFATLAKEYSKDDTSANVGGDMGWFRQDAWGKTIATQLAQLKDNEISKPFQSEAGWHILQRLGERQSDQTVQIARDQARQAIGTRKSEQVYDDYLRDLRSNAYINILVPELRSADDQAAAKSP